MNDSTDVRTIDFVEEILKLRAFENQVELQRTQLINKLLEKAKEDQENEA